MRKFIDIIKESLVNELSVGDDDRDEPESNGETVAVTNICWYDADGEEVYASDLPTEVNLTIDEHRESTEIWVRMAIDNELEARFGERHGARPSFYDYQFV